MSASVGGVEIEISREFPGETPSLRSIYARLLTPEIEAICRRQNIDTADINSLKWPIFGLSRYATAKILVLRSDLFRLLMKVEDNWQDPDPASISGERPFRIWLKSGALPAGSQTTCFNRMWLANITPLAVTASGIVHQKPITDENGDPVIDPVTGEQQVLVTNEGEALYILTFHDSRWLHRGTRLNEVPLNELDKTIAPRSWRNDIVLQNFDQADYRRSPKEIVNYALTVQLGMQTNSSNNGVFNRGSGSGNIDFNNDIYPSYSPLYGISPSEEWFTGFPGIDSITSRPLVEFCDYLMTKCNVAMHVRPRGLEEPVGQYEFTTLGYKRPTSESSNYTINPFQEYMARYGDDLIAGSVFGKMSSFVTGGSSSLPQNSKWVNRIISYAPFEETSKELVDVIVRRANIPDGRPPDVFKVDHYNRTASGLTSKYLPEPFSQNIPGIYNGYFYGYAGNRSNSAIFADEPMTIAQTSAIREKVNRGKDLFYDLTSPSAITPKLTSRDFEEISWYYMNAVNDRRKHEVCDLWFRGWIEVPPPEETWMGAAWIEYRLQTDSSGFGFPTTRIYSDYYDPLFVPQADDRPLEVSTSGLAKSWRDARGKNHISVEWPFGIPCLIKITGNDGPFNAGVKAWSYRAKLLYKGRVFDNSSGQYPPPPSNPLATWPGQLKDFSKLDPTWADQTVIAYNLAELANTSTFAGPGYKLPLPQSGFDILPIGLDRLGEQHEVIVQATLYMSVGSEATDDVNRPADTPVAYFCLTNAIDGDCPTPLTDNTYDGGVY